MFWSFWSLWSLWLAHLLIFDCEDHLEHLPFILSRAVLRSVWVEPDPVVHATMWQPMLKFLKGELVLNRLCSLAYYAAEFPNAWELEREEINEGEGESESEDSHVEESKPAPRVKPSVGYAEFLRFLERGCSGSPLQGYPTIVVIISTIPSSVCAAYLDILYTSEPCPRFLHQLLQHL